MTQAPEVSPADREGPKISTGHLPIVLYVIGVIGAIGGALTLLSGDLDSGASAILGGLLLYASGDVVRSLRITSGRCTRG